MKKIISLLLLIIIGLLFVGCVYPSQKKEKPETDSTLSSLNQNPEEDDYYSEIILNDIKDGQTENSIALFSPAVRDELGEENLSQMLKDAFASVQGNILSFTVSRQPATRTRGGNGADYEAYEIIAYTDLDIYEISLLVRENDPEKENIGLEFCRIMPVGSKYLLDGNIDVDLINSLDIEKGAIYYQDVPAKQITYLDGNYTRYSVSLIQMNTESDLLIGANRRYAEMLLSDLSQNGLQGEISEIHLDGDHYQIIGENGEQFTVQFDLNSESFTIK